MLAIVLAKATGQSQCGGDRDRKLSPHERSLSNRPGEDVAASVDDARPKRLPDEQGFGWNHSKRLCCTRYYSGDSEDRQA
jgi:hypothetical protein